jgi:hypothetical protein
MKFKKMIDLCKKRGFFHLFVPTGGEQWISDGAGCYPLGDVPMMDEDILCAICDIPEKAREKMRFLEGEVPHNLCFDDVDESESLCDEYPLVFGEGKDGVIPYRTSQGIQFIAKKYMAPLEDCDRVEVYERISKGGRMYFAVKRGYSLVALIMPYDIISEPFVKDIENLAALCKVALQNQKAAHGEQMRIDDHDDVG